MNTATLTRMSQNTANDPIDRLGALKAQITALTDEAKPLEADIKKMGPGTHSGQLFDANVAQVDPSTGPDPVAMEAKLRQLGVDDRWFSRNQKVKAGYLRLTVKARGAALS